MVKLSSPIGPTTNLVSHVRGRFIVHLALGDLLEILIGARDGLSVQVVFGEARF